MLVLIFRNVPLASQLPGLEIYNQCLSFMLLTESASSTLGLISEPAKGTESSLDGKNLKANVVDVNEPGILSVIPSDRQQDRGKQPACTAWLSLPRSLLH